MKIHHIRAGTLCPFSARLVNGAGGLWAPGSLVCHAWLIEGRRGLILVDTGLGRDDLRDPARRLGRWFQWTTRPRLDPEMTAWNEIRALGFDPDDVRDIVLTHLDLDHAGGLPDFPRARVHVLEPEYRAAMARAGAYDRQRYRPAHWAHEPDWVLHAPEGEPWFGFESVRALGPDEDVLLVPLFGHSRGHAGVAARTDRGWALHAGDAYFSHAEMQSDARCPPGLAFFQRLVAVDNDARKKNRERLRAIARDRLEIDIHCAHCPFELARARGDGASGGEAYAQTRGT